MSLLSIYVHIAFEINVLLLVGYIYFSEIYLLDGVCCTRVWLLHKDAGAGGRVVILAGHPGYHLACAGLGVAVAGPTVGAE